MPCAVRVYTKTLTTRRGDELPQSKLNAKLVKQIRDEWAAKEKAIIELNAKSSAKAMARRYQVSVHTINKVLSYQSWRHVL